MLGFSFLVPAFLVGLGATAVPIVLHLLRRQQAPRLAFSAVHLLRRAPVERTRRKRLRELLLLALRVAALACLAIAFTRPYRAGLVGAADVGVTVVLVDTSFSLSAPGQIDQARQLARAALDAAPAAHRVGVVAFDDAATVVAEPTADRASAAGLVARLAPGFGATRYRAGLARAAELIGARPGRIVVVSDLQRSGWVSDDAATVPEHVALEVAEVEAPPGNLAVTEIRREPARTVATIWSSGPRVVSTHAALLVDGESAGRLEVRVAPGAAAEVAFPVALADGAVARVEVDDPLGYPADNVRYLVASPPERPPVLLVTATGEAAVDALYLERALLAGADRRRFQVTAVDAAGIAALGTDPRTARPTVVLATTRGLDRRARAALAGHLDRGGGMLVVSGESVDARDLGDLLGGAVEPVPAAEDAVSAAAARRLVPADPRHPIARAFGGLAGQLGQPRFHRTVRLRPSDAARVIVRFSDGSPALVEVEVGNGRVLIFASDLDNRWNDFPRHPTFLPFVHETVGYLAAREEEPASLVVADAPVQAPREPGVVSIDATGRRIAINVDRTESDPARMSVGEFEAALARVRRAAVEQARLDAAEEEADQALWRYGLLLMAAALVVESWLGRRMA